MSALRWLGTFWIPGVATIVLGGFSNAFAQQGYKITDFELTTAKTTSAWPSTSIVGARRRTLMGP